MSQYDDDHDDEPGATASERAGLPVREREYIIPAQDAQGHSARAMCRIQPSLMRLLADIHQSKKYPFRVLGDVVRFCIDHGARRLAAGAGVDSVIAQADAIQEILRDEEYQLQFAESFLSMKRVLDRYVERGAAQKARELVIRIRAHIIAMPEGYWRTQYEEELDKRYGSLLDGDRRKVAGTSAFDIEHDS